MKKLDKNKIKKIGTKVGVASVGIISVCSTVFGATDDPLSVINNLKDFMYQIIGAIGLILLLWGIVQVGMAVKSHDPSQRANGFMTLARRCNYSFC